MESGIVGKTEPQMGGDPGSGGKMGKVVIVLGREGLTCGTNLYPQDQVSPVGQTSPVSILMCSLPSV